MANSAQARKRARQAEAHRQHNASMRSAMRTTVKKVLHAVEAGDKDAATAAFRVAQSSLDGMARKGIIAKNKASRSKSRLNARIKAMA
ncbi:30S ribosomal protein S20 [Hydrogenovibrio marinus]|uniref:Small ribosomal subunit protein bS20 n=1 Tax=Hydrogenovibrio marinus TaxID=28885 RepID=A0A066ZW32_HYDMR|nr:30S ribosomal protein S20 [Hydrogenovibrio marinus]KDN96494.1 30S ribosomal protein S20 [Hydrogenovibrio marinus]BBN60307.1 30S ribosomal protein S20 [Hydrogenovibrio marinus]